MKQIYLSSVLMTMCAIASGANVQTDFVQRLAPQAPGCSANERLFKVSESVATITATSAEGATYKVTCDTPDDGEWMPETVYAFNNKGERFALNGNDMVLPAGSYDFMAMFSHKCPTSYTFSDYRGMVILEQIEVNADMTLNFDPSTCVNTLRFESVTPSGETYKIQHVALDDNWEETVIEDSNWDIVDYMFFNSIGTDDWTYSGSFQLSAVIQDTPYGQYNPNFYSEIHVNDVSDRITFSMSTLLGTGDSEPEVGYYFLTAEQKGSQSAVLRNDPAYFFSYTLQSEWTANGANTPDLIAQNGLNVRQYGLMMQPIANNRISAQDRTITVKTNDEKIFTASFCSDGTAMPYSNYVVAPVRTELYIKDNEAWGYDNVGALFMPVGQSEMSLCIYPADCLPIEFLRKSGVSAMPGNENFTAPVADVCETSFATVPALYSVIDLPYSWGAGSELPRATLTYTGRLGERRNSDKQYAKCDASVNGVKVAADLQAFDEWFASNALEQGGQVKLSLVNENCIVDGDVVANVAEVVLNMDQTDFFAPTLTMLQFRNEQGQITSSFNAGKICLAAADINNVAGNEDNWYQNSYTLDAPASVTAEYAISGSEQFEAFELDEQPASFVTGALGSVYTAVVNPEATGWYDVRITVVDAAGNSQQQTLRKAFQCVGGGTTQLDLNQDIHLGQATLFNLDGTKANRNSLKGIHIAYDQNHQAKLIMK